MRNSPTVVKIIFFFIVFSITDAIAQRPKINMTILGHGVYGGTRKSMCFLHRVSGAMWTSVSLVNEKYCQIVVGGSFKINVSEFKEQQISKFPNEYDLLIPFSGYAVFYDNEDNRNRLEISTEENHPVEGSLRYSFNGEIRSINLRFFSNDKNDVTAIFLSLEKGPTDRAELVLKKKLQTINNCRFNSN